MVDFLRPGKTEFSTFVPEEVREYAEAYFATIKIAPETMIDDNNTIEDVGDCLSRPNVGQIAIAIQTHHEVHPGSGVVAQPSQL